MHQLKIFLSRMNAHIRNYGIDDVLDLVPVFEEFKLNDWRSLMTRQNGDPETTILYQSDLIKLILIYWKEGQSSSVHGHPAGGGLIRVISGELEETRFEPDNTQSVIDKAVLDAGALSYIHDMLAYHQVCNHGDKPAISLHLYSTHAKKTA